MNRKLIYIIFIIIVILSIVGYFVYKNKNQTIENIPEDQNIEISNENLGQVENGVYKNDTYGFSINLPAGMTATNFNEVEGMTILIGSGDQKFSMQVFVSPFDEDIALTTERIKTDIPEMKMIEPIEIKTDGVPTVAFFSEDAGEKYREVWFVKGGNLYQVLSLAKDDNLTGSVMEGWEWKE